MKPALLLLCHRIPFPPNKGDKIRTYHLLRYLAEHYRVYLGAFIDDPLDWKYVPDVEAICEETLFIKLDPVRSKLKCLKGFVTGEALSVPYYHSNKLQRWTDFIVKTHEIERAMVVSSVMAQFVIASGIKLNQKIIDIVDIDSDKWQQYSTLKTWPMNWIYRREAKTLLKYEKQAVNHFDATLFVSSAEANMFKNKVATSHEKIGYYNNGVDSEYFVPSDQYLNPYEKNMIPIVFTGAMDYWPNIDAVKWFVKDVFPALRTKKPALSFYIVGSNPSDEVVRLGHIDGVIVTGRVEDIRPYIQYSTAVVAPMRIARGIQNKVLEAMAMEKTVIVSPMGLEGINAQHGVDVIIADTANEFIQAASNLTDNDAFNIGIAARKKVQKEFNWCESLPLVKELLESNKQEAQL